MNDDLDGFYEDSPQHRFGRPPSRTVRYMYRVLSWTIVNEQIVAEDPKYFGILHEWEAIQYGVAQKAKGLHATVSKTPTLEAMDKYAGLKTTEVWNSADPYGSLRKYRTGK